ncbi:MAG: hypothetical protein JNK07_19405 [Alphaproteobacteria bacterium]|nr:hypothetical protein [Alphaproteobacteria bacterium]
MTQPLRIEHLDETLRASGQIESQHALQLRRMIYAKGAVTRKDADILFKLDRACSRKDASFAALYVEALTDYFVWQSAPKGYVTPELGKYLIENVAGDGHVARKTELELVLNVVHWARSCPDDVVSLVLDAVRQSVLLSRDTPYGANRPRAAIGAGDVAVLRKALHAPAGDGSLLVTRREAEILFQLNEATGAGENDPAWRDFFVRALANHLLNPMDAPAVPTHEEALRREKWLDERGSVGKLLSGVGSAIMRGDIPFAAVWEEIDPTGAAAARKEAEAEDKATRARLARERVDADEAKWLAERILKDGAVDENERALLAFLKKEAGAIDGALEAVMKRAGL